MVVGEELGCNADVVVVDWRWDDGAFGQGGLLPLLLFTKDVNSAL
jgi:hypothetical protein